MVKHKKQIFKSFIGGTGRKVPRTNSPSWLIIGRVMTLGFLTLFSFPPIKHFKIFLAVLTTHNQT